MKIRLHILLLLQVILFKLKHVIDNKIYFA